VSSISAILSPIVKVPTSANPQKCGSMYLPETSRALRASELGNKGTPKANIGDSKLRRTLRRAYFKNRGKIAAAMTALETQLTIIRFVNENTGQGAKPPWRLH